MWKIQLENVITVLMQKTIKFPNFVLFEFDSSLCLEKLPCCTKIENRDEHIRM